MFADSASGMSALTLSTNYPAGSAPTCRADGAKWAMAAKLSVNEGTPSAPLTHYCVDSSGASKAISADITTTNC